MLEVLMHLKYSRIPNWQHIGEFLHYNYILLFFRLFSIPFNYITILVKKMHDSCLRKENMTEII